MAINKIVYGRQTLIDLTGDNVTPDAMLEGTTAHNKAGLKIVGKLQSATLTVDSSGNGTLVGCGITNNNGNATVG